MLKKKKDFKERKEIGWSRMAPIFSKPPTASSSLFHSACHGEERTRMMGKVRTSVAVSSVQLLNRVRLFVTPWTAACQASLSITNSRSLLKLMSIALVMPFNHLILCRPLILPPSIFPSIRVFSNESALRIRWPKYWSFSFNISLPMSTQD